MAQIDFSRAFTAPDKHPLSASASTAEQQPDPAPGASTDLGRTKFPSAALFGRPERVNIIFATFTFIGVLFCAFYFFNGSELWRAAAAWPGELLYPRPAAVMATLEVNQSGEHGIIPEQDTLTTADHTGDPFSRTSGFLSLAPASTVRPSGVGAGLPATSLPTMTQAPFAQLGFPAPGGDALKQAFDRAVADIARTAKAEAGRIVVVLEKTPVKLENRRSTKPRQAAKRPDRGFKNSLQQQTAWALQQQTASAPGIGPSSAAQNVSSSAGNFSSNTAQQTLNSTRSTLSSVSSGLGSAVSHAPVSLGGRH
jgi:hypothetical protein